MTNTDHGFTWGPINAQRTAIIRGNHVMRILTDHHDLEISVSPTGKSIRVYLDGQQLERNEMKDAELGPENPRALKELRASKDAENKRLREIRRFLTGVSKNLEQLTEAIPVMQEHHIKGFTNAFAEIARKIDPLNWRAPEPDPPTFGSHEGTE